MRIFKMMIMIVVVTCLSLWALGGVAAAQEVMSDNSVDGATTVITLSPLWISFLAGTLSPLVAGIATKAWASPRTKAIVGTVCAIVAAIIAYVIDHSGGFEINEFGMYVLFTLVSHVAMYQQVWKPLTPGPGAFTMSLTPKLGVGGPNPN